MPFILEYSAENIDQKEVVPCEAITAQDRTQYYCGDTVREVWEDYLKDLQRDQQLLMKRLDHLNGLIANVHIAIDLCQ